MPESDGLKGLVATGTFWIGISDNGGTPETVLGVNDPSFTNWAMGQPSTTGNNHCAEAAGMAGPMAGKWDYARCTDSHVAICECEP
jgi:hypothetical protein